MPQITLEYTSNISEKPVFATLFNEVHQIVNHIAGIKLDNCKSRARVVDDFFIGDGSEKNAFVHLDIRFIEGRSAATKQAVGEEILTLLKRSYPLSMESQELQITVEVGDILRESYFKHPEGSLTRQ